MDNLALNVNSLYMFDDSLNSRELTNNLASNKHPRLDAYKKNAPFRSSQEERRKKLLSEQKKKRSSLTNSNRNLNSDSVAVTSNNKVKKSALLYNNQLMFSEWLEEQPIGFESEWIMVVCPVGKRCLIVAMDGITTAYTKTGKQICRHSSRLPGGNRDHKTDYTILDCIFNYELQTYFVLDVLVYKSHPVMDSETEFRFFWLKCKLDEADDLNTPSFGNPYKFADLPRTFAAKSSIQSTLASSFYFDTDGLLFYHKETHYIPGHTPLVLWLKPYMLPEILDIPVSDWIKDKVPGDYKGYKDAVDKSNTKNKQIDLYLKASATGSAESHKDFNIGHFESDVTPVSSHKEENLSSMAEQ